MLDFPWHCFDLYPCQFESSMKQQKKERDTDSKRKLLNIAKKKKFDYGITLDNGLYYLEPKIL